MSIRQESDLGKDRREPLAQRAYEKIKEDILNQRLLPRQPLVEAEMASEYGMSKTPVREALATLTREGLVEMNAFRGGRVKDFSADDVREIYELREVLEPYALKYSTTVMNGEDLRQLRQTLEDARAAIEEGQQRRLAWLNRVFHSQLMAKCGNSRVIDTLEGLQDQVQAIALRFWKIQAFYLEEAEQHEGVLTAIEAGNAQLAAELLAAHIKEAKKKYVHQLG